MSTLLEKRTRDDNNTSDDTSKRFRTFDSNLAEKILESYPETKPVKKNKTLQRIFFELQYGPFEPIERIETLIKSNDWRGFDNYCAENRGVAKFWETLQNLFYWYYYCPEDQRIDFTPMQKALGIQQAQWQLDPENEYQNLLIALRGAMSYDELNDQQLEMLGELIYKKHRKDFENNSSFLKHVNYLRKSLAIGSPVGSENVGFLYFQEMDEYDQQQLCRRFSDSIQSAYKDKVDICLANVNMLLQNSIWYEYGTALYGIPATYDMSSISCLHQPILVFGSLKPKTMVNFIIETNRRPFAAFLPGSSVNLYNFDDEINSILLNWRHDFNHQNQNLRDNGACNFDDTKVVIRRYCEGINEEDLRNDDLSDVYRSNEFQDCLNNDQFAQNKLLDNGFIYKKYNPTKIISKGGKRRKTNKRKRKTQKRKRRKTRKCHM